MAIYDIESLSYDDWYQKPIGKFIDKLQTKLIFDALKPNSEMKILDVGCGTGNFSIKLAKLGCDVIGVDVSEAMLKKARENANTTTISFKKMKATKLNFSDNYFDAVISITAFEFIENNQLAFNEMMRVCKPNAPIIIGTLHKNSSWGNLYESDEMRKNSIFKYAKLKSKADLQKYDSLSLISISECLHMNPTFIEKDFTLENEQQLKNQNPGGFICGLWKK
ncbi:MAG: class I SAM-dependent methyltransferase [Salinivirgaceae bacterium]|nr:class I SAM-dependent methyltransferase [Salinivirgaceae bacterium]